MKKLVKTAAAIAATALALSLAACSWEEGGAPSFNTDAKTTFQQGKSDDAGQAVSSAGGSGGGTSNPSNAGSEDEDNGDEDSQPGDDTGGGIPLSEIGLTESDVREGANAANLTEGTDYKIEDGNLILISTAAQEAFASYFGDDGGEE